MHKATQVQKTNPNKHSKFHVQKAGNFFKNPKAQGPSPTLHSIGYIVQSIS
jgi:hypothetical protein